jgi:hypothetical protein
MTYVNRLCPQRSNQACTFQPIVIWIHPLVGANFIFESVEDHIKPWRFRQRVSWSVSRRNSWQCKMVWLFRPSSPPSRAEATAAEAPQIVVAASSEQVETLLSVAQFSPANTAAMAAAAEAAPAVEPPEAVPLTPAIETVLQSLPSKALQRPTPRRFRLNTSLFRKPPPSTPPPKNRRSLPQQKASVSKVRRSKGHASSPRQQRRRHSEAARLATSLAATTSPAKLTLAHNEFQIVRSGSMSSFNSNWNVGDDNDSALYNSQDGSVGDGSSINVPLSTQSSVSLGTNSTRSTLPVDNTHNSLSVPPRLLHNFGQQVPPSLLNSPDSTNQSIFSRAALTREDTLVDVFSIVASSSLLTSSSVSDHDDDDNDRIRTTLPRQYQKPLLDVVVDDSLDVSSDYSQDDPASNNNHSSLEAGLFAEFKAEPNDDVHPPLTTTVEELVGVGLSPIEKRPSLPVAEEDDDEDEDAAAYITVPCRMRWVTTPPSSPAAAAALRSDGSLSSMSMSPPNAKSLDVPLSSPDSSDLVVFESRSSSSAMSPPRLLEPMPPPAISRQADAAEDDNAAVDVNHSPGQVLAAAPREPTTSMVHKYQQFQAQASVPSMKKSLSPTAAPGPALATTAATTTLPPPTLQIVGLAMSGRPANRKAQVVPFSVEEAMKKVIKKPGQRLLRSYYQAKMMLDESETDATEEMTESARQADLYPIQEVPAAPPVDLHQKVTSPARQRLPSKLPAPGSPGTRKLAVRALSTAQSPTRIPIPKSFRPSARPLGDSEPASVLERVVSKVVSKQDSVPQSATKIVSEADPYLLYYQKWYEKGLIPWSPTARPAVAAAVTTTPSAHPIPGRTTAWLHHVRSATWKSVDLQPLNEQVDDNDTVQSSVVASVASPTKNEPSPPAKVEPVATEVNDTVERVVAAPEATDVENDTVERVVVASPTKNEPSSPPQPLEEEPELAKVEKSATEPLESLPGNQVELQEKIASEPLDQMELQEEPKVESVEQATSGGSPDAFDEILEQILDPRESDTEEASQDSVQVKGLLVQTTQFPEAVSPLASPLAPHANSILLRELLQSGSPPEEPLRDEAANNANKKVEDDSVQQTDKGRQGKPEKSSKKKSGIKGFFNRLLVKNKKTEGAPVRTKERKVRRSAGHVSSSVTNSDLSKPNGSVRDVETGAQTIDSSGSGDTGSGGNATNAVSGVDPVSARDVPPLGGPQPIPSIEDDLDSERFPSPIMSDGHEDSVDYDVVSLAESSEISEETRGADSSVKQTNESNPNLFDRLHHPSAPPVDDPGAEEKGFEEIDLDQGDEEVAERIAALVAAAENLICEIDAGRLAPVIPKVHRGAPVLSWFGHVHSLIPADCSLYLEAPTPEVPASSSGRALVKSLSEPPISTSAVPELNVLASDSWKSLPSPTTLPKTDESPSHLSSASRVSEYQRFVEAHKKRVQDRRKSKTTGEGESLASF